MRACSPDAESARALQVKLAGPRPVRESKPLTTPCTDLYRDFGRGHRLYVGGVAEAVTREGVRHHFAKWGVHSCSARSEIESIWLLQPLKSINVAEDRKDDGHQASFLAGNIRSPGPLATSASATLHMSHAADSESLPGYVSGLELQHQYAMRQLATMEATNVPTVHQYSAGLPHHSHRCSHYPCGPECFLGGVGTNQVSWPAPVTHSNSLATTQAACECRNWNGMSFPLPGSLVEMEGSVANLESTDTSLSLDNLARLAHQSILEASGHNFNGGEAVVSLMLMLGNP